jgi:hypothetical protein
MIDHSYLSPDGRVSTCFFASLWNRPPYDDMIVSNAVKAILADYLPFVVHIGVDPGHESPIWDWLYENVSGAWHDHAGFYGDLKIHFEDEADAVAFQLFRV